MYRNVWPKQYTYPFFNYFQTKLVFLKLLQTIKYITKAIAEVLQSANTKYVYWHVLFKVFAVANRSHIVFRAAISVKRRISLV